MQRHEFRQVHWQITAPGELLLRSSTSQHWYVYKQRLTRDAGSESAQNATTQNKPLAAGAVAANAVTTIVAMTPAAVLIKMKLPTTATYAKALVII
ncbi:hypothetical protein [Methylophilus sp.]|uniref:hypothetical protein n=1 Tax=Methylophilus sp. TaxID=29541 RepID=UPI0025806C5D|nr:hypothetical protein [Methylophilus sp.]